MKTIHRKHGAACEAVLVLVALLASAVLVPPALAQADVSPGATGDLRLAHVSFSSYEGGPALPQPVTFQPGDQVVVRVKVAGYRLGETSFQDYRVGLSYEVSATDARGIVTGKPAKGVVRESVHKEDKDWLPTFDYLFLIPEMSEYGETRLNLWIRDDVSQREQRFEQTILVNGKKLPAMESIGVINFGFYRRQEDPSPLPAGVYRPGDRLWVKFDLAGFQVEAPSRFHAECDFQIRDGEGKVLFESPKAFSKQGNPEYPQRYVPGIFSLEIRPGTPKGNYAIAVIVHDRLSGKRAEAVFPFSID